MISFTADENDGAEPRHAKILVSYPGAPTAELSVTQEASSVRYDYDYQLSEFSGTLYKDEFSSGFNGEHNFNIFISDLPLVHDNYQSGGHYYNLDIFTDPSQGDALPAGTYVLGEAWETAPMTFTPEYSSYVFYGEDDWTQGYFKAGTIEVAVDGETYSIEGCLTDMDGLLHHISYTGPAVTEIYRPVESSVLDKPLDIEASLATANFASDEGGVMGVNLQFTDMQVDDYNYVIPPGALLYVEAYMPYDKDGAIAAGKYTVEDTFEPFTMTTGYDGFGSSYIVGTYVEYVQDEYNYSVGLVSSGTMEVSGSADSGYTIVCDFLTEEGISVKCSWEGKLPIAGMPGPISTLEGDYEVDLSGTVPDASFYGDYYRTGGGNWIIRFTRPEGESGDGLSIDLVGASLDGDDGIPSGTYTATTSSAPGVGEYLPGYIDGSSLYPTLYLHYDNDGYCDGFAPAESGNIDIVNHGDGSYDISFECTDDRGNVWSGSWSGEISILDTGYSSAAASSAKTATLSHGVSISSVTAAGRETAGAISPYALKVKKPAGGAAAPVRRTVE